MGEGREARTEVVQGHPHAELSQALQVRRHGGAVREQGALGDLDAQMLRRKPGVVQDRIDEGEELGLSQLHARHVHGQPRQVEASLQPGPPLPTGRTEHPLPDRLDDSRLLRKGNELAGGDEPVLLRRPAHERFQPDADWSGTAQLEIETSDLGNTGDGPVGIAQDTIDISVTPVNDAPTHDVPGAQTGVVGTSLLFSAKGGNGIVVSDVDASVVQVTLRATDGTVTLASLEGLSFGAGDGAQDTVVTFSGSLAAVNAALDGLRFEPSAPGTAGLEITTDDLGGLGSGGARSTASTVSIEVAAPDLPPEIEEETPPEEEPTPSEEETGDPGSEDTPSETSQVESIPPLDDLQETIDRPGTPGFGMPSGPLGGTPAAEAAAETSPVVAGSDRDRDTGGSRKETHGRFEGGGLLAMSSHLEQSLDRLRDDLTRSDEEDRSRGEVFFSSIRAAALATSTGVLTALLRGGSLLALTFSSLPVWKGFDPLAVLALTAAERKARKAAMRADEETEDEAVAQIFEED